MWIDIEQNTPEWLNERLGLATSSNFSKIMANEGKAFGEPAKKYARKIALEIVTKQRNERDGSYSGGFMADGHELEPIAVNGYEMETFIKTTNGGFYKVGNFGDSPDRNAGEDGALECKGVIANTQWVRIERGGFDTSYKWQICGHIWLGNKKWCDFVSYCPEMPENKQLYVFRVERDEEMISRLEFRLNKFWAEEVEPRVKMLLAE
jgi:hypothetical protein